MIGTRAWLGLALRMAVSAALLVWLFRELRGGWQQLGEIDPLRLWPAALVFALSTWLGALQWTILLRHSGVALPRWQMTQLYWIGLFANNFLPGNVGGDVVKVADVAVHTGRVARPIAGTLLDRILGLIALVSLGLIASAILGGPRPAGLPWWILGLVALGLLGLGAVLLSRRLGQLLARGVAPITVGGLGERLTVLLDELQAFRRAPGILARVQGLALVVQFLRVMTHVMVASAMDIPLDAERILGLYVLVPVLGVAIVLPISFNGLGLREWVATRLLPDIGIAPDAAFALQFATYLVQVAVSGIGGLLLLRRMAGRRAPGA